MEVKIKNRFYLTDDRVAGFQAKIDEIKRRTPLYIKGRKDDKFNGVIDIITTLYQQGSNQTVRAVDDKNQKTGYCRSITDLHRLCKHYLPEVKIIEIMDALSSDDCHYLNENGDIARTSIFFCDDVNRLVVEFFPYAEPSKLWEDDYEEEFSIDEMFTDEYAYHLCKGMNV